ncbi:hypothetical protein KY289_026999 [Solanum tuberosum]|nr:hypothetical protein KY289_026999 [Solanum tuberosum]
MARPFMHPPLTPAKAECPQRPELTFQNKFKTLADYPRLPYPLQPKIPCPPQPKLINLRPTEPFNQGTSSSSIQTKASYTMKAPESFAQERIQYLCKQIQVKGWVPQQPNVKVQSKDQASSSSKSSSKAALKEKLKDALDNLEKYDGKQIMKMIEDAASTESSSEDNSDICNPKGLALAYMDPDYE